MKISIDGCFKSLLTSMLLFSCPVVLAESQSLCVFDLLGANGPIYVQMKDYKVAMLNYGVDLQLKPYTSEKKAATDFETGVCDSVCFTGTQSRHFNLFSGSLDAMGALPSYSHLKMVIAAISTEQASSLMINDPYEVAGIIPIGSAYLFVNDRALVSKYSNTQSERAKIRVAIMDSDPAQSEMMGLLGTSTVATSIAEMYEKFNAGQVDVTYGPAVIYEAMELYKGLQPNGGVIDFPIAQLTLQIMIRKSEFPVNFGQKSREYSLSQFNKAVMIAKNQEQRIAKQWWLSISKEDQNWYHEMYRKTRILLRNKGVYDGKMLKAMRLVRCKKEPNRAECFAEDKE